MKVALVHDYIPVLGGAEKVLSVLAEMFPDAPIYTAYYNKKLPLPFAASRLRTGVLRHFSRLSSLVNLILPLYFENIDLRGFDVIISSGYYSKGILTRPEQIHINYCHTPPRFLYGLPSSRNWSGWRGWLAKPYFKYLRCWDYISARRPNLIVANSKTVAGRIKKWWGLESRVIYPPVEIPGLKIQPSDFSDYFLVVSRLEKYKNIDLIIQTANQQKLPLKIVGSGSLFSSLKAQAGSTVELLGWVDSNNLSYLYQNCRAVIFASQDEDFGIGAVEAQSYGKPVIAFRSGGFEETVVEGLTGVFFDQLNVESLTDSFRNFDQIAFDSVVCRANAERYSTERFKKEIGDIVDKTLISKY